MSCQSIDIKDESDNVDITDTLESKEESGENKPNFKGGVHVSTTKTITILFVK